MELPTLLSPVAQTMQVQCPEGVGPGGLVQIQAPSGEMMQVTVPEGVEPGTAFTVPIPGAQVATAKAVMQAPAQCAFGSPYDALAGLERVEVQEKADMVQALTAVIGLEIDMPNKYKILDENGQEYFFAVENTGFCTRQMKRAGCADCVGWDADVLYTFGGASQQFLHMSRDHSCTCCCFNRPIADITDVASGQKIGSIKDPCACCDLTFTLMDAQDNDVLYAKGGCCQLGLCCPLPCGPCSEVHFDVTDAASDEIVGHVTKKVPNCLKWCWPGESVDNYRVDFQKVQHPQWKAMLMVLSVFIDFRYFSETQDNDGLLGFLTA